MQRNKFSHKTSLDPMTCLLCWCSGDPLGVTSAVLILAGLTHLGICWLWAVYPLVSAAGIQCCSTFLSPFSWDQHAKPASIVSWQCLTEEQASKTQCSSHYLDQVYWKYHQPDPVTWWSRLMAGHPAPVRRPCRIAHVAEGVATGRDERWWHLRTSL